MMEPRYIVASLVSFVLACSSGEAREVRLPSQQTIPPARIVDSILPVEEALRRFRQGVRELTALEHGAASRDALVGSFVEALQARDTIALRNLSLSRAEFAWLYYPTSVFSREPYYQMPQLSWSLHLIDSEKGISRALERLGGDELDLLGYNCPDAGRTDGAVTFWDRCRIRLRQDGVERELRLFGSIAESGGRFKFYSYANDL